MAVLPRDVDREKGNGSRSELEDTKNEDIWTTKDKRAPTSTTFHESDIENLSCSPHRKKMLKRILRRHEGENDGETYYEDRQDRTQQNRREDTRRLVETIASQLDCTQHQKQRSMHIVLDVIEINSYGPHSTEEVILGVMTYVCMEDMGDVGVHVDDRSEFHEIVKSLDTSMERVRRTRKMTRERLK